MKFSTCFLMTEKKGFFIFRGFFDYEELASTYEVNYVGFGAYTNKISKYFFERGNDQTYLNLKFKDFGAANISSFSRLLLKYAVPHRSLRSQQINLIIKLFKTLNYRGRCMAKGLPSRGQHTHSNNSPNIFKARIQVAIRASVAGVGSAGYSLVKDQLKSSKLMSRVKDRQKKKASFAGKSKRAKKPVKSKSSVWR